MSTTDRTSQRPACLLCSRRPSYVGIWVPFRPPAGHRLVAYYLCQKHFRRRKSIASEIESALSRGIAELN
jgi:hypothetical protein